MNNYLCLVSVLAALVASSLAFPYPYPVAVPVPAAFPDDPYHQPVIHKPVVHGYGKPEVGRVKIQVYRGPSKLKGKHGYEEIYFAPWGYYVTQPEDAKPKYGYHH